MKRTSSRGKQQCHDCFLVGLMINVLIAHCQIDQKLITTEHD